MVEINSLTGLPKLFNLSNDTLVNNRITKNMGEVNPFTLIVLIVIILLYYALFRSLKSPDSGESMNMFEGVSSAPQSPGLKLIEILMWGVFLFLILINGIQYFFNVDIKAVVKNIFTPIPEIDLSVISNNITDISSVEQEEEEEEEEAPSNSEVFHVSKNKYTYDDAKAICKSYNSKLATYEQIENAYKDGAEWCSYGWSENQMTLFPTQKETWEKLQEIDEHKNDCGRPGINGGYIDNVDVRYGANCYGVKPKSRPIERQRMVSHNILPKTKKEKDFDRKVRDFKHNKPSVLLSPFNYDSWGN
jgi:hypothetical protein